MVKNERAMDEAIGWLIRQRDPHFADWGAFSTWLEAKPGNADAYAELSAREEAIAERLARTRPAEPPARRPLWGSPVARRRAMAGLTAIAASVLAVVGITQFAPGRDLHPISTSPGSKRVIELAGGSRLRLNGATLLRLDRDDPRYAEVERGEVVFEIVHDVARPFRVEVGGAELVDMGTRFNVLRRVGLTEVAVAEGEVLYKDHGEQVRLTPGKSLQARDSDRSIRVSDVEPATVDAWTEGRLIYRNAPLSAVADDLARNIGVPVRVDGRIAARPVTAVIQIPDDREQLAPRLELLLDIKVRRAPEGWVLTESR